MLYFQIAATAAVVVLPLPLLRVYRHSVSYHHIIIDMSKEKESEYYTTHKVQHSTTCMY